MWVRKNHDFVMTLDLRPGPLARLRRFTALCWHRTPPLPAPPFTDLPPPLPDFPRWVVRWLSQVGFQQDEWLCPMRSNGASADTPSVKL